MRAQVVTTVCTSFADRDSAIYMESNNQYPDSEGAFHRLFVNMELLT